MSCPECVDILHRLYNNPVGLTQYQREQAIFFYETHQLQQAWKYMLKEGHDETHFTDDNKAYV